MRKARVLFVCIENSCRSQIAEGLARRLGGDSLEAWSAGSKPSGQVHPTALALMKERGVNLSGHRSKGLADLPNVPWDYVIGMGCGDACPLVPTKGRQDWDLPDPKNLPLGEFRDVIDRIEERVRRLVGDIRAGR